MPHYLSCHMTPNLVDYHFMLHIQLSVICHIYENIKIYLVAKFSDEKQIHLKSTHIHARTQNNRHRHNTQISPPL